MKKNDNWLKKWKKMMKHEKMKKSEKKKRVDSLLQHYLKMDFVQYQYKHLKFRIFFFQSSWEEKKEEKSS